MRHIISFQLAVLYLALPFISMWLRDAEFAWKPLAVVLLIMAWVTGFLWSWWGFYETLRERE